MHSKILKIILENVYTNVCKLFGIVTKNRQLVQHRIIEKFAQKIQKKRKDIIYLDDKYARSNGVMAAKKMLDVCDVNYSKLELDKSKIKVLER